MMNLILILILILILMRGSQRINHRSSILTFKNFSLNHLFLTLIFVLICSSANAALFNRCAKSYGGTELQDNVATEASDFNCDFDGLTNSVNNITTDQITDGTITDADISTTGITSRSKLPGLIAYLDTLQTFTNINTFSNELDSSIGTITTDVKNLNLTSTWNNASQIFTSIFLNVTNTLSMAGSLLMNLEVGGSSVFSIDPTGKVTAGSDPVNNLDLVTLQYYDNSRHNPAESAYIKDEFCGGAPTYFASITVQIGIGDLAWQQADQNAARFIDSEANHPCIVRLTTTNNTYITSDGQTPAVNGSNLLPASNFDSIWIIRENQNDTNTTIRAGFVTPGTTGGQPDSGIYLERTGADVNWSLVCRSMSAQTKINSLVPITTNFIKARIRRKDAGTIGLALDANAEVTCTTTIPTIPLSREFQLIRTTSGTKTADIDYFDLLVTGITR